MAQATPAPSGESVTVDDTGVGKFQVEARMGSTALLIDEPKSVGGLGSGPNPYDLMSAALGACTLMTIRLYAARKAWLGGRQRMRGSLTVDAGCAAALGRGGSLLATGVTGVEGDFARGDPVAVRDVDGRAIAQGLVEYTSDEVAQILGRRSDEIEKLLGYAPRAAVIHRDQLVLL